MTVLVVAALLLTLVVLSVLLYPLLARESVQHVGSVSTLSIGILREQLGELDDHASLVCLMRRSSPKSGPNWNEVRWRMESRAPWSRHRLGRANRYWPPW